MNTLKNIISVLFVCLPCLLSAQQTPCPEYEYRAVWLTTIENLDWPVTVVKTPADTLRQKNELIAILDSLENLNINTVLLQTRVRGDVIYPSAIEPFSKVLTGVEGRSPGYDPLAFAIEECHKRGMQLHAWIVTLPLGKVQHVRGMGRRALKNHRPELCRVYKGSWYMEPGEPATADYLCGIVKEIVANYNVDGIHLDYIRYPDRPNEWPDAYLHRKYGGGLSRADWRRNNITNIVRNVYSCVKELKPWVRVSCAPIGKYSDLSAYSSHGYNALNTVYQDAQLWLREGIMDILFPMLYFRGDDFYPFVRDWQENSFGRHVVPGLGTYRLLNEYGGWEPVELMRQMYTSRVAGASGTAMFRARHLLDDINGFASIYGDTYKTALPVPPIAWCATLPSMPPCNFEGVRAGDTLTLRWHSVQSDGMPKARYNVYLSVDSVGEVVKPDNLMAVSLSDTVFHWNGSSLSELRWAVTAVDAFGVESEPVCWNEPGSQPEMRIDELLLDEPPMWGMRIVLRDAAGVVLYSGRYRTRVGVRGLPSGVYLLEVCSRDGAVLERYPFTR